MRSLYQYIIESTFTTAKWSHGKKYDYATAVIDDILLDKDIKLTNNQGELKASDFNKDELRNLRSEMSNLTDEEGVRRFNNSYNGSYKKKIWSNIEKTVYSGRIRKLGGGLKFEAVFCQNIRDLIVDPSTKVEQYEKATMKFWNEIKDKETIKSIIKQVSNGADVDEFVQVTGKGSTARNNIGQLINKETFEVNMSKKINLDKNTEDVVTNVLTQSGKIIADITISDKPNPRDRKFDINHVDPNDIYISCKDSDAQFTGISMQQPFYGDAAKTSKRTTLIQSYERGESYREFLKHDDICTKAFSSMCKMFGCDPEEVYNYFSLPKLKRSKDIPLTVRNVDVSNDIISTLIQLQVGGNYWYVNSNGDVVYLDDDIEKNRFKFVAKGTGKMEPSLIRINGFISTSDGNVNCDLVFRTSGDFEYPYRLFFDIKDHNIIQKLYC